MIQARAAGDSAVARCAGSFIFANKYLGLAPQALCYRLLRRLIPQPILLP
jgi:hypothetical protein